MDWIGDWHLSWIGHVVLWREGIGHGLDWRGDWHMSWIGEIRFHTIDILFLVYSKIFKVCKPSMEGS